MTGPRSQDLGGRGFKSRFGENLLGAEDLGMEEGEKEEGSSTDVIEELRKLMELDPVAHSDSAEEEEEEEEPPRPANPLSVASRPAALSSRGEAAKGRP